MKNVVTTFVSAVLMTISCQNTPESIPAKEPVFYNICLILDGTDRLDKQQAIPTVDIDFVMLLAEKIQHYGEGTLWLSWIDDNSENNSNANLILSPAPVRSQLAPKKDYETRSEYSKRVNELNQKFIADSVEFERSRLERLSKFRGEALEVIKIAYSERVARNRRGSDINGAINLGGRLIQSNPNANVSVNHLILVSDLVDNVGKSIEVVLDNITITSVNQSFSKHSLGSVVQRELASLDQIDYIFK